MKLKQEKKLQSNNFKLEFEENRQIMLEGTIFQSYLHFSDIRMHHHNNIHRI